VRDLGSGDGGWSSRTILPWRVMCKVRSPFSTDAKCAWQWILKSVSEIFVNSMIRSVVNFPIILVVGGSCGVVAGIEFAGGESGSE